MVFLREQIIYHHYMMLKSSRDLIPFDRPATYNITVQGRIDPTWSARLEGMTVCWSKLDSGVTTTILQGELNDQAALAGVLNMLYELHLTVLSVKRLEI